MVVLQEGAHVSRFACWIELSQYAS